MRLLSVVSEAYPLVKTGGLADVAGALPGALIEHGIETRTLLPGYPAVLDRIGAAEVVHDFDDLAGGPARLIAARVGALDLLVVDGPHLYARAGGLYGYADDAQRFAALARVAAAIGFGLLPGFVPDIVHAHDWQAALTAAYLHYDPRPRPGTVVTIHNLAFQGQFPAALLATLALPPESFTMAGVEYYGDIGFLKAGLRFADRITTVSPTYATEICAPELGMGMDGLLRERAADLRGILNGIDVDVWNPATDPLIAARYDASTASVRAGNKAALQRLFGMPEDPGVPLFGLIARLSWQKGIDLVLDTLPVMRDLGAQVAIVGAGDASYEASVGASASASVGVRIGYDEPLAHLMQAGADALLVPSRFEPCGLTQLCALRYGAVPIVARTGGLADTVIDASPMALAAGVATGVQFLPATSAMLASALRRAVGLYRSHDTWRRMQENAMRTDVSWRDPARRYAALYGEILRG